MRKQLGKPILVTVVEAEPMTPEACDEWVRTYVRFVLRQVEKHPELLTAKPSPKVRPIIFEYEGERITILQREVGSGLRSVNVESDRRDYHFSNDIPKMTRREVRMLAIKWLRENPRVLGAKKQEEIR